MTKRTRLLLRPVPEVGQRDTSLQYTDILFGFVIWELFRRLSNFPDLDSAVRWHLLVGVTLVLGSWIGYRRSSNRSSYEVKFFNLPFFKFVADQLMLIVYFRIAILTPDDPHASYQPFALATDTSRLVLWVFVLYLIWDALGIWMAKAHERNDAGVVHPRYPRVQGDKATTEAQQPDWSGILITSTGSIVLLVIALLAVDSKSNWVFPLLLLVLLAYRFSKDVRTSWRSQEQI